MELRRLVLHRANLQRHVNVVALCCPIFLHGSPVKSAARRWPSDASARADKKAVTALASWPIPKRRRQPVPLQETPRILTPLGARAPPPRSIGFPPYCW